ncbi:hypothetical protein M9M90_14725 [Phenylobacterium sp. LH3H17]|uniref:hypothetical protein n=1 Tax=Phenylobacterium sp. LH3H17 TaxID=2903901 RepID=UPI0020C9CF87|nr:hypothetical protein [Phenylobacterium sp. LH3H17]UTP38464.1 hypothetical protein M9M90_14725 [Phenylobacterium sp. LH3H17]
MSISIGNYIEDFAASPLSPWSSEPPWTLTSRSDSVVRTLLARLDLANYRIDGEVAAHHSATVEDGAILKGPAVIGPRCFIAAGAYVRGGCWLDEDCILGPGAELKSSFVFRGSKLAHFNFVGDSVLGRGVNLEAGSIVTNYRNEKADKQIRFRLGGHQIDTGVDKFGVLAGDGVRVGANAVIAPGAVLAKGEIVKRLTLVDQS